MDKPKKPPTIKESVIQKNIITRMRAKGYKVWKVPLGAMLVRGGGKMIMAPNPLKGFPDLLSLSKHNNGRMVCIEVKSAVGKLNPKQKEWENILKLAGVLYFLARDADSVIKFLEENDV